VRYVISLMKKEYGQKDVKSFVPHIMHVR
jgi:hypothetical protein